MAIESINYIVAGYPGPHSHNRYFKYNYADCIINQLIELTKYKHNLDTITVVINDFVDNLSNYKSLCNFIKRYKKMYSNVEVMFRENKYISYGGFLYAFEHRKKDYDKYILMEYDYSFCVDDFDKKLSTLQVENNLDAMFALWGKMYETLGNKVIEHDSHGIISLGIISHNCFYKTFVEQKDTMKLGQFEFTRAFHTSGFKCGDWKNEYGVIFYNCLKNTLDSYSNKPIITKCFQEKFDIFKG